jgi:DNA-binding transcriptional MerR regulator
MPGSVLRSATAVTKLVNGTRPSIRTVDLARAAGVHENTVRLYVDWGFLSEPERSANGYRLWTSDHLDQMVFARQALHGSWPGPRIRASALALVRRAARGELEAAYAEAKAHAALVGEERARAEEAAAFLDAWAQGRPTATACQEWFTPRQAAEAVCASPGQIRNWERNHLLDTPREPGTGYRRYTSAELGRLRVIRTLLLAGYSLAAVLRMTTALDRGRKTGLSTVLNTLNPGEEALTAFDRWLDSLAEQQARAAELSTMLEARLAARRRNA